MNNLKKLLIVFNLGLFLTGISSRTFGQTISDTPAGNNIPLDSKTLYEHGYNSSGADSPREDIDTVMVGSVMNYFVMPNRNYNTSYFGQSSYAATNLTVSRFDWTALNGAVTAQAVNTTGTSPWIKVTWGATTGATTVEVQEVPQGLSVSCVSEETTIPVWVIAKPTIGFSQVGSAYAHSECYDETDKLTAFYDFPVSVTTSSTQVLVNITVVRKDLESGSTLSTVTQTDIPVASGLFRVGFSDYGAYEVTITKITDRIARKCDTEGDITGSADTFTFSVMPMPQTGVMYHIPNNF